MTISLPALRRLGTINKLEDMKQLVVDLQANFNLLSLVLNLNGTVPAAGHIQFLVQEPDGTWHHWELLAGAGVTLTPDSALRTLTISSP